MKKLKKHRGLIISIVLAFLTVMVLHQYIQAVENQHGEDMAPFDYDEEAEIVVTNQDLSPGTVLTTENLETKTVYKGDIHPEAVTDKEEVLGEVLTREMVTEEVLLHSKLLPEEEVNKLSHSIPEDKRAMSVSVDEVSGVAGFIQAGDRIDAIATIFDEEDRVIGDRDTETIIEEIKVLAAGEKVMYAEQELIQHVSTVTLAVTSSEAEILADSEQKGTIRLLLRPLVDED